MLTKIQIYILTRAELFYALCYEIPCTSRRYDIPIVAKPQYLYAFFTFLPVLLSFLFTILHWRTVEETSQKRWKTLPLLILQIWPQSRVCRILHFFRKGNPKWQAEKDYFEMELSTIGNYLHILIKRST